MNQTLKQKANYSLELRCYPTSEQREYLAKCFGAARWIFNYGLNKNIEQFKALNENKYVLKIDRYFPSSKLCSSCGFKNTNLTLKNRQWICPVCGKIHDRDLNASLNILKEGRNKYFNIR